MCLLSLFPIPHAYPNWPLDNRCEKLSVLPILKNVIEEFPMEFVRTTIQWKRSSMIYKVAQETHFEVYARVHFCVPTWCRNKFPRNFSKYWILETIRRYQIVAHTMLTLDFEQKHGVRRSEVELKWNDVKICTETSITTFFRHQLIRSNLATYNAKPTSFACWDHFGYCQSTILRRLYTWHMMMRCAPRKSRQMMVDGRLMDAA